jgi:hypothetical protein
MPRDRRIDEKAAELGVLEEHAVQGGRVAVGAGDDGLEIIDHEPFDDAAEERPRAFEAGEHGGQILAQADGEERVPTETQRDE